MPRNLVMTRYSNMFNALKNEKKIALIPFFVLGFPNIDICFQCIQNAIEAGADALEFGLPFSDPIADGPTIVCASQHVLNHKISIDQIWDLIYKVRVHYPTIPIGLLVYANLILNPNFDQFYQLAQQADIDSILIADVPIGEFDPFEKAAIEHGIDPILLATPKCTSNTLANIAQRGKGYTYMVSRVGVTGVSQKGDFIQIEKQIEQLHQANAPPCVIGFGISESKDIQNAKKTGAQGVIVGSALVKLMKNHNTNTASIIYNTVKTLKKETQLV